MKLILSTDNIMGGSPSVLRLPVYERSNTELIASLRANFSAHRSAATEPTAEDPSNPSSYPSFRSWTIEEDGKLKVPSPGLDESGLTEDKSHYDITVKLFYLPNIPSSSRGAQTREAVDLVLRTLGVKSIDLLILSFPGISFDADDEDSDSEIESTPASSVSPESTLSTNGTVGTVGGCADSGPPDEYATMLETWRTLEGLHDDGVIAKLGIAEFGTQRLTRFLAQTRIPPSVDQINVRDCCVVPKPLILFAKKEGIELLTHNDCTNILPKGTLRELLGPEKKGGYGVLAGQGQDGLTGDVEPHFVVKYTAVVKDTGVVENKGYFAVAGLRDE